MKTRLTPLSASTSIASAAFFCTAEEIKELGYNLDLCGFPNVEEEILEPDELINNYKVKRESLNAEINSILAEIEVMLGVK